MTTFQALTIAGSDPTGGAGIQADLKTFHGLGVYGLSVITAITSQNTFGVHRVSVLPEEDVATQLDAIAVDLKPNAIKIGMLGSASIIRTVATAIRTNCWQNVIADPVLAAKGGEQLTTVEAKEAYISNLLPLLDVITPNVPEAQWLLNMDIRDESDRMEASRRLVQLGARAVVIKGGHMPDRENTDQNKFSKDLLYDGERYVWLAAPRSDVTQLHGTGCLFASALAAEMAKGLRFHDAAFTAKCVAAAAFKAPLKIGGGYALIDHEAACVDREAAAKHVEIKVEEKTGYGELAHSTVGHSLEAFWYSGAVNDIRAQLKIYLVMGSVNCRSHPVELLREAIAGGVTMFQFREKGQGALTGDARYALAQRLQLICRESGIPFIVNDDVQLAKSLGADGLHIGQEDLSYVLARNLLPSWMRIGVSAHNALEAKMAELQGADYIGVGPMYATQTKTDAHSVQGPGLISQLRHAGIRLPIIGIGGINADNAAEVICAGADGVAVVSAIAGAEDVKNAAGKLLMALSTAHF